MRSLEVPSWIQDRDVASELHLADDRITILPYEAVVTADNDQINFRQKEFEMFLTCGMRPDKTVEYDDFARVMWAREFADNALRRTLKTTAATLRNKLPNGLGVPGTGVWRPDRAKGFYVVKNL